MKRYLQTALLILLLSAVGDNLKAQLRAAFTSDTTSGCAPLIVRFKDSSTGNPIFWRWDLGNGTVSFAQNPSTTYFVPGTYSVKLYSRNNSNDADSISQTQYITVYAPPVVSFKSSDTAGCYPLRIRFNDLSSPGTGSIVRWEWDFGDGTTDSVQNPEHVYAELGKYNVTLRVRNSNGCIITLSKGNYINVNNGVKAAFDLTVPDNCRPPAVVSFKNLSSGTGVLGYKWNFGDGTGSTSSQPLHSYTVGGSYAVKLTVSNNFGCVDSLEKLNAVTIGLVKADFNLPASVCAGNPVSLTNTSSPIPVSTRWTLGPGQVSDSFNTSVIYPSAGSYPIKLLSDFGTCKDSIIKSIQVLPKPRSAFSANKPAACRGPLTVNFVSQSENAVSYLWLFGDGTRSTDARPSHVYNQRGSYDVTLITTGPNGCSDTLKQPAFVRILPPAIQMQNLPAKGCAPLNFQPKYNLESADEIAGMVWDFGDGTIANGLTPAHSYTKPGVYTVKVAISTRTGCVDSFQFVNSVKVGLVPVVDFSANLTVACAFQPISFKDLSTGDPLTEWHWDFDDTGISEEQNPVHIFSDTGFFSIKLKVSSNGCESEITKKDFILIRPPLARFFDSSGCAAPLVRRFTDSSLGAQTWFWDFGDGSTSSDRNPVHTFPSSGTYFVSLTVTNDTCENTARRQIRIVSETPDFTVSANEVCKGASVSFASRNINRSNISSQTWIFGDGFFAGLDSAVSHRYNISGTFSVALAITDIQGCSDTLRKDLYMKVSGPTANFTSSQPAVCLNGTINFTDLSAADPGQPINQWAWNYGDGVSESLSAPPFAHAYNLSGNMLVSLKVTDSKGCTDSVTKPGLIFIAKPVAAFRTADTITCATGLVSFVNTSTGNPVSAVWNFGDMSAPSMALQATHRYLAEGRYDVSLSITDRYGCKDSTSKPAYISVRNPRASFNISDTLATCPPLVSTFTNSSINYNFFEWDFGDGNRSFQNSPVHFYNLAGIFNSRLIVESPGGCRDTAYKQLVVRGPQGDFVYDKISGCSPVQIKFTAQTKDNVSFIWDYNDGTTDATPDSIVDHRFVIRGKYLPRMILIDPQGCKVPITAKDSISVFGVDAGIAVDKTIICDSGFAFFRDASLSNDLVTEYLWKFGDGGTSTLKNPAHLFPTAGNYPVNLAVKTLNGCTDDADKPVSIQVIPTPVTSITAPVEACVPGLITFIGNITVPDNSVRWTWDFGNGERQESASPAPVRYPVAGDFRIRSIATNSFGCADTSVQSLVIHPLPVITAGPDDVICLGQDYTLRGNAVAYQWSSTSNLSCTNCANPVTRPESTSLYVLNTTDQYGCRATDSVIISVKQPFTIQASLGDTLCLGKSLALFARGAELFTWSPALGLNNPTLSNPLATPQTTTTYMVIGRDNKSCFSDTAFVPVVVYNYPIVNAGPDQTLQVGNTLSLKPFLSNDITGIQWTPSTTLDCPTCGEVVARPRTTTTYSISVINKGKCESKDDVTINVICRDGNLFMPNTFTPNGDGNNDVFYPRGKGIYGIKSMKIFNRWGELVFQQYNFQANDGTGSGWNGKYKGRDASQDVYVYTIEVICENNQVLFFKGDITLVR